MIELSPSYYGRASEVFKGMSHNLAVSSVLGGSTTSTVYADNASKPSWAVTSASHRILVSHIPEDYSGVVEAVQTIIDKGRKQGKKGYVIYYPPDTENPDLGSHLKDVKAKPYMRNFFELDTGKVEYSVFLPEGYRVEKITSELLSLNLTHTELVEEEMQSERSSVEEFLAKSHGFCLVNGPEIAAWCMTEYDINHRCEIGIETHRDHRRKGLATEIAKATINHVKSLDTRTVGWHCWLHNEPSNRTALRLGFKHVCEYPVEHLEPV